MLSGLGVDYEKLNIDVATFVETMMGFNYLPTTYVELNDLLTNIGKTLEKIE